LGRNAHESFRKNRDSALTLLTEAEVFMTNGIDFLSGGGIQGTFIRKVYAKSWLYFGLISANTSRD
jgi:hypothetical protein